MVEDLLILRRRLGSIVQAQKSFAANEVDSQVARAQFIRPGRFELREEPIGYGRALIVTSDAASRENGQPFNVFEMAPIISDKRDA